MRFTVNTQELTEAVSVVTKALPAYSSLPILEGIYIRASINALFMKCSDLSLQIETKIPAIVKEEGCTVLPGRLFSELAKRFTGESTDFICERNTMKICSGNVKTALQTNTADDYPEMVRVDEEFSAEISQAALKSMIRQTIFAVSYDENKPALNGIFLKFGADNELIAAGLDGFRLAVRKEKIKNCTGEKSVIIPTRAMQEISNILMNTDAEITLVFSSTHVKLDLGGISIISRLLEGKFFDYEKYLPKSFLSGALVDCKELRSSIERASLMAKEGKYNMIKMSLSGNCLLITANSEIGNIADKMEIQLVGGEMEIAFNAKFFLDMVKSLDEEKVYLRMNNSMLPCVIEPMEGDAFYYMLYPVRMFNGA